MKKCRGEKSLLGVEKAVPCWSDCFAGGAVVETGGCVVAHGRRLPAAVLLFQAAEREVTAPPFSSVSFPLLSFFSGFPLPSRFVLLISYPVSSFSFLSLCSGSSLSILSVLSLSVRFFFSSVRSPFSLFISPSPACWRSVSIYRGQRERGLIMAA